MCSWFESEQKQNTTASTKIPANFQNLMNRTLSFANEGLDSSFQAYEAPRIANLSGNEQAGIAAAGSQAGMYQPLINMAYENNAAMQAQGGLPGQQDIMNLINPYAEFVGMNAQNRLNEASDRNMTNIGGMAGMAGAFGGSRHGVLEGANLSELLKSSNELWSNTYSDAYDKGMNNWFQGQNLRRGTIQDAMGIAQGGQQYNTQDINNLMSTGLTERTRNQSVLDFGYSEFLREQQDPFTKAGFASSVMQGFPTNLFTRNETSTTTQTPSPFSQVAGIGLAAAGMMTGNPAAAAGLSAGANSLGKVPITTIGNGANTSALQGYMAKGGKVKAYAEGGSVDPIGELIRDLEAQDAARAKGQKIPLSEKMKRGRQSTNVEDRRGQPGPMSPDAQRASRIPLGPTSFLRDLFAKSDSPGSDNWLVRFLQGDPEAAHYMALRTGNDPDSTYDAVGAASKQAKDAYDLRYGSKYAKGGKVKKYSLGGILGLDYNAKNSSAPTQSGDGAYGSGYNQYGDPLAGGGGDEGYDWGAGVTFGLLGGLFGNDEEQAFREPNTILYGDRTGMSGATQGAAGQPKTPFNWEQFMTRMNLSNVTPGNTFPSQNAPRLPGSTPDISKYQQAMQSRINPGAQGTPRTGYADGGVVISGSKKTRVPRGSNLKDGMKHDGSVEDITYLLDQFPDEDWAPTEGSFDGTHQPVQVDRKDALRIALQKHETGAKDYENPNYFANSFKGKENSHAFGLGQWQPSSWNAMATSYNRKNKDKVRFMTQDDVKADRLPTKDEQNKIWSLWEKQILRDGKGDHAKAFAAHQLGGGDLSKVLNAPIGAKMKDVVGDQIAKNVSAKNETVGQYFDRLNKYIGEGEGYLKNKLSVRGGNMTDVVQARPTDANAMAAERRPHNFGPLTEQQLLEAMRKRGDSVFTGVQPDGRRDRIRKGPNLGEPLSALETVMGGKLPKNAEPNYLDSLLSTPVSQEDLEAPSRFTKGGIRPFNKGGYVKGYATGKLVKMPDGTWRTEDGQEAQPTGQDVYMDAVNKSRRGMGLDPLAPDAWTKDFDYGAAASEVGARADQAHNEASDILNAPWQSKSRLGRGIEGVTRTLGSLVPATAEVVGRGVQGGMNVMDFLTGDLTKEGKPNSIKAPAAKKGPFGDLNLGIPDYGQNNTTSPDAFNTALEEGEPDEIVQTPARQELDTGRNKLNDAFEALINQELEDRKNRTERDNNQLFGMNVNMPLIKMGLGILANSGYPNSAGEAIGKGILGGIESEEQDALKKSERDGGKLKELVNLRYMQAMVESMDPNIKMQLQKEKGAQEAAMQKFKSDYEFNQWLSKQNYSEEMQKRLIKFRAETAAAMNNPFGDLGEARTDLSGE